MLIDFALRKSARNDDSKPEKLQTTSTAIVPSGTLTVTQFQHLAEVPPEIEWFANLTNANTRRAYRQDLADFMSFAGLRQPAQFRDVTRHALTKMDTEDREKNRDEEQTESEQTDDNGRSPRQRIQHRAVDMVPH
jgi:site-specific recombinase XerD